MKKILYPVLLSAMMVGCTSLPESKTADNDRQSSQQKNQNTIPDVEGLTQNVQSATLAGYQQTTDSNHVLINSLRQPANGYQPATISYTAKGEGVIGLMDGKNFDNPDDNRFRIQLKETPSASDKVWLSYELYGVSDAGGIAKSINERLTTGGYLVKTNNRWTKQSEQINAAWVRKGENTILFTIAEDARYGYKVRNLSLRIQKGGQASEEVVLVQSASKNKTYVHGMVAGNPVAIYANGKIIENSGGEFETILTNDGGAMKIEAVFAGGKRLEKILPVAATTTCDYEYPLQQRHAAVAKTFIQNRKDSLQTDFVKLIAGQKTLLNKTQAVSITPLRSIDLPAMDQGMSNITRREGGFRFLPHGKLFSEGEEARVAVAYDRKQIPNGYTEDDIRTYYFDNNTGHWEALERDTIDKMNQVVVSRTTHFTDMINGVIKAPESPETQGFAPTMMNDIKAADPTAKVQLIQAPGANSHGTANTGYSFEMPPARNGMAPQMGIQYNSDGGQGWLGEGWDLSTPSVSVDTRWGVPRYDGDKETETYSMGGAMLMMLDDKGQPAVAHRGDKIGRKSDRQFYPRTEGSFSRIIRKGRDLSGYTWEVTDKSGTKYTYGGSGAVLKGTITTVGGTQKEVITEWKLSRVEEPHGDYIDYEYETVDEVVKGSLTARSIYLKEMRAGNKGQQPHTVVRLTNSARPKSYQSNSARYGFLTSSNQLLEKVDILFEGELLRSYAFTYKTGAFSKDILDKVTQKDKQGKDFASHTFDYYDDVKSAEGYKPFKTEKEIFKLPADGIRAASALGGSKTSSISGSFYAGIGVVKGGDLLKGSTAGASVDFSLGTNKGVSALIDINGDGMSDKVFEDGRTLYYRPNLSQSGDGVIKFGDPIVIQGISEFSKTKTKSFSYGGKVSPGYMGATVTVGIDKSKSTSTTTVYFRDINNDGLVDLVRKGTVYFNHIEIVNGVATPTFTLSSGDTPAPITGGGDIDAGGTTIDPADQEEAIKASPLYDAVRVWEAPFAGAVNISGTVQLQIPVTGTYDEEDYSKADGVRVAIQTGGSEKWSKAIAKDDATVFDATVNNLSVQKGQRIFFRLQSGNQKMSNGAFDQVAWAPVVSYVNLPSAGAKDPDGHTIGVYKVIEATSGGGNCAFNDALVFPSSGVARPTSLSCSTLMQAYKDFIVEFPGHTNGATVRLFVPDKAGLTAKPALVATIAPQYPVADTAKNKKPLGPLGEYAPPSGTWKDSVMTATQLFEWYMSSHLQLSGYSYNAYADWLVNDCGYLMYQLPWQNEVHAGQDTLQAVWNRFMEQNPASAGDVITRTESVGLQKGMSIHTLQQGGMWPDQTIYAMTGSNGIPWFVGRSSHLINLAALPPNAAISGASLDLYASESMDWAAHFRYNYDTPYVEIAQIKGSYMIPATNLNLSILPSTWPGTPVAKLPVSSEKANVGFFDHDFYSNQNYLNQDVTPLISSMYANLGATGINYGVAYKLNDESFGMEKRYAFEGVNTSVAGKSPALRVTYTAARSDVFAAFVNNALGTYLSAAQAKDLYAARGLTINTNYTDATAGSCAGSGCAAVNLVNVNGVNRVPVGAARIAGRFVKPVTSGSLTLQITLANDSLQGDGSVNPAFARQIVYSKTFAPQETSNGDIAVASVANSIAGYNYSFNVTATGNVAWENISWKPVVYVSNGGEETAYPATVNYGVYSHQWLQGEPVATGADTIKTVVPVITWMPGDMTLVNGELTMMLKKTTGLLAEKKVMIVNGLIQAPAGFSGSYTANGDVWTECYTTDAALASKIAAINMALTIKAASGATTNATQKAALFTTATDEGFGPMYRGWGQFIYNAAEGRYEKPIDESLLKLPNDENAQLDPLTMPFVPFGVDIKTKTYWSGPDENIYLQCDIMSASRLGDDDVALRNPLEGLGPVSPAIGQCIAGTGAIGYDLVSVNKSIDKMAGASFGVGVTYNDAEGESKTITDFNDMNGDGYPDIISEDQIQYTDVNGGFHEKEILKMSAINHSGKSKSHSWGLGGTPIHATTITAATAQMQAKCRAAWGAFSASLKKGQVNAKELCDQLNSAIAEGAKGIEEARNGVTVNASGSIPVNEDWADHTLLDINGDGLPDRILSDKKVQLNLGYAFSEPVDWGLTEVQSGKSTTVNLGAGGGINTGYIDKYDMASGSISAGMGLSLTTSKTNYLLTDINSDGLADKVRRDDATIYVSINTGNGFLPEIVWQDATAISESSSNGFSVNAAYTIPILIPMPPSSVVLKIPLNPGLAYSTGSSRQNYEVKDMDGDGYADIVSSYSEDTLVIQRSTIARTNKLKTVHNPLGGSFTLDYNRTQASYDHPGGKWVLTSVTADDGVGDDGPNMKIAYRYEEGRQDRHEREFLGFGRVITENLNTADQDKVYRRVTARYDVSNIHTAGNELGAVTEDAGGNKYAESSNTYYTYKVSPSGDDYSYSAAESICGQAISFTPLKYTRAMVYEGKASGTIANESYYEYWLDGNYGELKNYKYSDKGTLGANGTGGYNYSTAVEYTRSKARHLFSLPVQVKVSGSDGKLYRQTNAAYDLSIAAHLTNVTQTLNDKGDKASADFEYDKWGNITKKTLPANSKGQRMWYKYSYDAKYSMYITRVDDAFGYQSNLEDYDYRYGMPLKTRDYNNYYLETTLDDMGRIVSILGPNEAAAGVAYTIQFEYPQSYAGNQTGGQVGANAITRHYDPAHPGDDIETSTFVDGFGRALQVKKDAEVSPSPGAAAQKMQIVSGRAKYDAFGRVVAAYYLTTDDLGNKTKFSATFDGVTPTRTTYDILDRALTTTLPDGATTTMEYTTEGSLLKTTATDAKGGRQASYTNGSGLTVKQEQYSGPSGSIVTSYFYDPINELLTVQDTKGNQTTSVYDMAGRRLSVTHPDNGATIFSYDNAGNLLTRQTANLTREGKQISYEYDYNRLTKISYPDHPENNVKYYYGSKNATNNRIGRLALQEDGSGAQEFYYGRQGELTQVTRTLIVPNQAIATYTTKWKYDTWNRLTEMIYPDQEKLTYSYNTGGQLTGVKGSKAYSYNYVQSIGYDKFEQRIYLKYCNGAETKYNYDPARRRLSNLQVIKNPKAGASAAIMDNDYSYDAVSNILSVTNKAPIPPLQGTGVQGGQMTHSYSYDGLNRLTSATGTYKGQGSKTASYTLNMGYDNLHNITSKQQTVTQTGVSFNGTLKAGYGLTYNYTGAQSHKLDYIQDTSYRTENTEAKEITKKDNRYSYDANGNLICVYAERYKKDGTHDTTTKKQMLWDEENRLEAVSDNGYVSNYWYDAAGERTVKTSGEGEGIYVLGAFSGGRTQTADFTLYVNPYIVVSKGGRYTKHIYIGSQRIVSKLGDLGSFGADPRRVEYAGANSDVASIDYAAKYATQQGIIKARYDTLKVPYNGKNNDDYVNGKGFCCDEATAGTGGTTTGTGGGNMGSGNDNPELYQYYYHSDHLGSSSFITNLDGEVAQHIEYVPFGEVFIEERNNNWNTPYKFNGKELDEETGLYYYGARYYDPKSSLWISVDPLAEKYAGMSPYNYCANNPVMLIDPDGREGTSTHTDKNRKVIAVYDDGDNGVYEHNDLSNWDGKSKLTTSGHGITKIGKTRNWYEFAEHKPDGEVQEKPLENAYIHEDYDASRYIDDFTTYASNRMQGMNYVEAIMWLMDNSKLNAQFDIKNNFLKAAYGYMCDGYITSGESIGNVTFGKNLANLYPDFMIGLDKKDFANQLAVFDMGMRVVGGYNMLSNGISGRNVSAPPYWGEDNYAGRMIAQGFFGSNYKYFKQLYEAKKIAIE